MTQLADPLPDTVERPVLPRGPRIFRIFVTIAIVVPALWSAAGLEISVERMANAPADIWLIVHQLVPDLSADAIQRALPKVMESVFIAWIGTMIGAFFSFPLAFLAAKKRHQLQREQFDSPGAQRHKSGPRVASRHDSHTRHGSGCLDRNSRPGDPFDRHARKVVLRSHRGNRRGSGSRPWHLLVAARLRG